MFTVEEREAARAFVLGLASRDRRITAGAVVGSFARGAEDRWSDIDLTFAVADDVPVTDVIADWSSQLEAALDAMPIWEGEVRGRTYKVFLLPGWLQVDLSFTQASRFRPGGPAFQLLFGDAGPMDAVPAPAADHFVGWGVLQAIHARRCIERGRFWQAEQAIGVVRDCALSIACVQHGLEPSYGRGFDDLPANTLAQADTAHVASLEPEHLRTALGNAVRLLLDQALDVRELPNRIVRDLRTLSN